MAEIMLLIGATAVPPAALLSAMPASAAGQESGKGRFLSPADFALLSEMAEGMIPKTDTPGAVDAGVPTFIDGLMIDWAGEGARAQLKRAVAAYAAAVRGRGASPADRVAALAELDQRSFAAPATDADAAAYRWLKRMVFLGYRTSEAAFVRYVPNPGPYRGNLSRAEYDALVAEKSVGGGA
jgi:hypothetical protein